MDDLGKKLKSLSNPFKTKFKGQGQKLGGADDGGDPSIPKAPGGVPRTGPAAAKTLLNQRLQQVSSYFPFECTSSWSFYDCLSIAFQVVKSSRLETV
jgi:hypothetical protein